MLRLVENAPSGADEIPVRRAVKAVIMVPPTEPNESPGVILLESENSGRFNIPGGGIKENETPFETFVREISEELGKKALKAIKYLEILGGIEGPATTSSGKEIFVHWTLLLMVLSDNPELSIGDGIAELHRLTAEEVSGHPLVTDMAKRAVRLAIDRGLDDLFPDKNEAIADRKISRAHLSLVVG
ncbi:MAG: NUDIX hydrolase [Candidatus Saccharimonadaceae bacterium]